METVPEVNDAPLPNPRIAPADLIALARWEHFNEVPSQELIDRLLEENIATPSMAGASDAPEIVGVVIWDVEVKLQVEHVPDFHDWWHAVTLNRQPRMSDVEYSFVKLVSERVRVADDWERRFKVLTGTTPGEGNTFTLQFANDDQLWPWDPFTA